eukprot:gene9317-9481_t
MFYRTSSYAVSRAITKQYNAVRSLDEGTPKGQDIVLEADGKSIPAYITKPDKPNGAAVILATDVFGYQLVNARLIADTFAANGYLCVVPNYYPEGGLPLTILETAEAVMPLPWWQKLLSAGTLLGVVFNFIKFLRRNPVGPAVELTAAVAQLLRRDYGVKKVALQGPPYSQPAGPRGRYCYGGKVGVLLSARPGVLDAVALAHPSAVKVPDEVEAMQVPAIFLCAEHDNLFPKAAREKAEEILRAKPGLVSKFVIHPGTQHGYAVRGSKANPRVNEAREDALKQAMGFFNQCFDIAEQPAAAATPS